MDIELYKQIEQAEKFQPDAAPSPQVPQTAQAQTGLEWAARQAQRPAPEPVKTMPPILPVAS